MLQHYTRVFIVLAMLLTINIQATHAQDDLTCEDALEQAETALENNDLETASSLSATAQDVCQDDITLYRDALGLDTRVNAALNEQANQDVVASADPGLVNIGDYSLFMTCEGQGAPTVIFENGLGQDIDTWDNVYPTIAETNRVCRYTRLGVGNSDDVPDREPRTTFEQSEDLHMLLETANIQGPFVLVGHSIAGIILTTYAHLYPDDVVGVVYVDASHPEQFLRLPDQAREPAPRGTERLDLVATWEAFQDEGVGDLGDIPIAVLTDAQEDINEFYEIWLELQEEHAARSTNSQHILVYNTTHFIQNVTPDVVIEAIQDVISQVESDESVYLGPTLISPEEYVATFAESESDFQLIDVRTPEEFAEGHIEGAINIPVQELADRLDEVNGDKAIVVYCRSGNRSGRAADLLDESGFIDVYDIDGGTIQWTLAELPLITDEE